MTTSIADLARSWAAALDEEDALRRSRGACECQHERHAEVHGEREPPCWKVEEHTYEGRHGPVTVPAPHGGDVENWCKPCQDRHTINAALREATRRRAGIQGALRVAARRLP